MTLQSQLLHQGLACRGIYPVTSHLLPLSDLGILRSMASNNPKEVVFKEADQDGHYRRKASQFRDWVIADPQAEFPAEIGRYVLYLNLGCPW